MTWSDKVSRNKVVNLNLKFGEEDVEIMRKIKDIHGLSWEDFFYFAAINVRTKGVKK